MILSHLYKNYRLVVRRLFAVGASALFLIACQELPTEPAPIDLSRDKPVAVDDQVTTAEDNLARIQVLDNDSSLVNDDLELTEIVTPPAFGTATIDGDAIEYVPEEDYNGSDSLRYRVAGSVLSATARVLITVTPVNDPPVANDDAFTVDETIAVRKGQSAVLDVLANDTDVDGDVLRVIRTSNGPGNGNVDIAADGFSVTYNPTTDFNGTDQFDYTISDGNGGQDIATVVVTIHPANDPPIVTNKIYATMEDETLVRTPSEGVLLNASDPDGDQLTAVLITDVEHGTLSLMEDGSFEYVPEPDFNGRDASADGFTFAASDGISQSAPATATINVIAVNDPPVASPDSYSTDEDVTLEVPAPGILANDLDIDGDDLTVSLITPPMHGELDLRNDGSFTYDPDAGFSGDDEFEYQIDDGMLAATAMVSISVIGVNDPPIAAPDQYDVAANVDLVVPPPGILENDTDEEGEPLIALLVDPSDGVLNVESNGGFTYTPPPGFSGTDAFTYRASDGTNVSAITNVVILVTAQGSPPVALNDQFVTAMDEVLEVPAPGVLENDTDADDDPLTAILVDDVLEGTLELDQDGGVTYTPPPGFSGNDAFTYRASDGTNVSAITNVVILVTAQGSPPVAVDDEFVTAVNEVLEVPGPGVLENDTDADDDPLTAILVDDVLEGTLELDQDGGFLYTPTLDFVGAVSFTYRASDGVNVSGIATVTIAIE